MNADDQGVEVYVARNEDVQEKWRKFINEFNCKRYMIPMDHDFIAIYISTLIKDKPLLIHQKEIFYRARINETIPYIEFLDKDLEAPPASKVGNGRLNPKGIPYLYIAYKEKMAISEIKPYIGAKVGIANCVPEKVLQIIDLTRANKENRVHNYRKMLSELFSQPVAPDTAGLQYIPTQYIAEYFKVHGFDGVKYQSSIDPAESNICLFNPEVAMITYQNTREVTSIDVCYK